MARSLLDPVRLPEVFWIREDVTARLRERNCGQLLRLVSRYSGASQTQLAIVTGLSQGQVSTIVAGKRRITSMDLIERMMDGLRAPDHARMTMGLAPRTPTLSTTGDEPARSAQASGSRPPAQRDNTNGVPRRGVLRLGSAVAFSGVASSALPGNPATWLEQMATVLAPYPMWDQQRSDDGEPPELSDVASGVTAAKRHYQAGRYAMVLAVLPGLLRSVRILCAAESGDRSLAANALAADAYQVAGSVMVKVDDAGLAALAAEHSVQAAMRSQDPVALAASGRIVTHSLMSGGHAVRARDVAVCAAQRLCADVNRPDADALSVYGSLLLRAACAAARAEDRPGAECLLDEADDAAQQLGRDDNVRWTGFGPTNVRQHRVHVAMMLGDAGTAVELASRIDPATIQLAERRAALFLDTARAYLQWGRYEPALDLLRRADETAPEEVRTRSGARRLVEDLATYATRDVQARAREFAEQIGLVL